MSQFRISLALSVATSGDVVAQRRLSTLLNVSSTLLHRFPTGLGRQLYALVPWELDHVPGALRRISTRGFGSYARVAITIAKHNYD